MRLSRTLIVALLTAASARAALDPAGHLAVLDFRLQVITRENLIVLLQSTGRKIEDCEGECEVDTGRRIGADLVISGDLLARQRRSRR